MEEKRSDKEEEARRRKERGAGRSDEEIEKKIKKKNDMKWGRIVNHLGLGLGFVWRTVTKALRGQRFPLLIIFIKIELPLV